MTLHHIMYIEIFVVRVMVLNCTSILYIYYLNVAMTI